MRQAKTFQSDAGVTAVEATLGIALLLFVALFAMQLVLFFHGTLAAKAAAINGAHQVALTGSASAARAEYDKQQRTALRSLQWGPPDCHYGVPVAVCNATVKIPSILPGGGLLFGQGSGLGPITVMETGQYPTMDTGG